eukprot:SM000019S04939  [mRNA]  locus=s19:148565:150122:+ [translate_table: standard]
MRCPVVIQAFTTPAIVLNAIAVAAYKKYVLVSLLASGQVPQFPKYTPPVVQRNLKSCAQDYVDIMAVYGTRSIGDLERCVAGHEDVLRRDNNLGLAKQVVASLYKRNIQRLTQTYLTLSLADIAATVQLPGPKEAELHILRMIEDGEIFATLNEKDGMVQFLEDPEQYTSPEVTDRLDANIKNMIEVAWKIEVMDEQISCDHAYLSKLSLKDRGRYAGDADDFELGPQKMFESM